MPISKKQKIFVIAASIAVVVLLVSSALLVPSSDEDDDKVQVVASFYPLGYIAEAIGGDKVSVTTLIPDNTEVHSWSPTASDILAASKADILVYNGAGLEPWMEDDLLPSIDTSDMEVVETAEGLELQEPNTTSLTRIFVFDNDNSRTLVYDIEEGSAVLVTTLPYGLNVTSHSGFFDNAPVLYDDDGEAFVYIPNLENLTVLGSGLHGDHFHPPEEVISIEAGKPTHYAISPDGEYIVWALDNEQMVLVVNTSAPGLYEMYDDGGTAATSHATVEIDDDGLLYIADMRTDETQNLRIVDITDGSLIYEGGAGESPHGGVYSSATDTVYLNCRGSTYGLTMINSSGYHDIINYTHDGTYLTRSWISANGSWLISYVGDSALGLAYSNIVAYDLESGTLKMEVPVQVPSGTSETGWAGSLFMEQSSIVALSNPQNGTVVLVNITTGTVSEIDLEGIFPQALRLVYDERSDALWAVTSDGYVHLINIEEGEVEARIQTEDTFGANIVLAAVSVSVDAEDNASDIYDPHTWTSPYLALQQAESVYEALVKVDPGNEDYYSERWENLKRSLEELDQRYTDELSDTEFECIYVSHSAYGYLAERYGFNQDGVIGISADEQPSSSAIQAMVEHMIDEGIYVVYLDPVFSDDYIQTLKASVESLSGHTVQVLNLYLMTGEVDGLDYLEQMEANLESLKEGLGAQ